MFSRNKFAMVVAEILGTAVLTSVILSVSRSPIGLPYFVALAAGLTLATLVLTVGPTSGAHANPAVTLGLWTIRKITTLEAVVYIVAQFMGAAIAWRSYMYLTDGAVKNIAGKNFDWRVLVAEIVGTFIFTFGIAAATYQRVEGGRKAAIIGLSLVLGILVASAASNGLLNPAVALGVQSWSKAYVFGPLVGGVIGMLVYSLLFSTEEGNAAPVIKTRQKAVKATASTRAKTVKSKTAAKRKPAARKRK